MKVDVGGKRTHHTAGRVRLTMVTDRITIDTAPDLSPLGAAITGALRAAIRRIDARSQRDRHVLFNKTGRFINSLFAKLDGPGEWSIRAVLNRARPERAPQVLARLLELVPPLRDPALLAQDSRIIAVAKQIASKVVTVGKAA